MTIKAKSVKNLETIERPKISQQIGEARDKGDLSENAEYHAAKEEQGFIEGRIQDIGSKLSRLQVIDVRRPMCIWNDCCYSGS